MNLKSTILHPSIRFILTFLILFAAFYYFNIFYFGITSPGGNHFNSFLATNLNYIHLLRAGLLYISANVINLCGFTAITNEFQLLVPGHGIIEIVYSCLGLGVMSFFSAFVIAYPKNLKPKLIFLAGGLLCIQVLNISRFVLLALLWDKKSGMIVDHHTIFNMIIYLLIAVSLYFWVKQDDKSIKASEKN